MNRIKEREAMTDRPPVKPEKSCLSAIESEPMACYIRFPAPIGEKWPKKNAPERNQTTNGRQIEDEIAKERQKSREQDAFGGGPEMSRNPMRRERRWPESDTTATDIDRSQDGKYLVVSHLWQPWRDLHTVVLWRMRPQRHGGHVNPALRFPFLFLFYFLFPPFFVSNNNTAKCANIQCFGQLLNIWCIRVNRKVMPKDIHSHFIIGRI